MASITTINIGGTSYNLNDARVSTNAVTTATHLLATNAGVTAINPITAADLVSVLGEAYAPSLTEIDELVTAGNYIVLPTVTGNKAFAQTHIVEVVSNLNENTYAVVQRATRLNGATKQRCKNSKGEWSEWFDVVVV